MTPIARIRPVKHPSNTTPYCEAHLSEKSVPAYYREKRRERNAEKGLHPTQCSQRSSYLIGNEHLCVQHAGLAVLAMYCEQSDDQSGVAP